MRRFAWIVVCLGCSADKPWRDPRANELVVGPYTIPIPEGWRNVGELRDRKLATKLLQDGFFGIVQERYPEVGSGPSIVMKWMMMPYSKAPDCDEVARELQFSGDPKAVSEAHKTDADGDVVCLWSRHDAKLAITGAVRFHNDAQFVVACSRDQAGDPTAEAACTAVLASLHIRR